MIKKTTTYIPDNRNTKYFNIIESETMEINQNNVELHIERYYHLSYFSDKKEIFLFTKQFIHNYNYFNISEKGYLRSLKDNLFFDYLDEFFGNFFQRYCVYKYIDTIKNLFSLYMKKIKLF